MIKKHKCRRCYNIYFYSTNMPDNNYIDHDDSNHYDCPICGKPYYPPFQDINIIGNIIRNLLL